jgi:Holliday junction DNA helicase RuvA
MIAYIKGKLESIEESGVVIDCGGIGFFIYTTGRVLEQFTVEGKIHEEVKLFTHLQIREDERVLFGFSEKMDLRNFKRLIAVNMVGPKVALSILDHFTAEELYLAVQSGDSKSLGKVSGVGPKTAQRIVLECKDILEPFGEIGLSGDSSETAAAGKATAAEGSGSVFEVVEALESLGYSRTEALRAARSIKGAEEMSTEDLLSAALKKL